MGTKAKPVKPTVAQVQKLPMADRRRRKFPEKSLTRHVYVYRFSAKPIGRQFDTGHYTFDRTFSFAEDAQYYVDELKDRGIEAVWLRDHLIAKAFY